jgi:hypothetical protein
MLPANGKICLTFEEAISVLRELEVVVVSLHKMGSFYADKDRLAYERETTRFIDEERITQRLAEVRGLIADKFDRSLGEDDMDDVERAMVDVDLWRPPVK